MRRDVLKGGILMPLATEAATTTSDESTATSHGTNDDDPTKVNQKVYLQELDLFMQLIRINPKSYWLWNHRCWCLESMPQPSWTGELKLVDKMLTMDERNCKLKYRSPISTVWTTHSILLLRLSSWMGL